MWHNNFPYLKFALELIIRFSILSFSAFGQYPSQGGASSCNAPNRNLRNSKHKAADKHATNTCDALPHPHVASVEPTRLETTHFQKCICMQDPMGIVLTFLVPNPNFFAGSL
jgi:hypothetical protein